jgi:cytochrome c-type biogenesis protein CcmE
MSITVTGTIERAGFGPGTWAIKAENGDQYEIYQGAPKDLLKKGQKVKITGQIREDVMTIAMIGPVLEVKSFDVVSSD